MSVLSEAVRLRAVCGLTWAVAVLVLAMAGGSAARADDNSAWFGQTYKGTNMGLNAGVMRLGAGSRAEGMAPRRGRRGTQLASLGRDYAAGAESSDEESVDRSRKVRRARTASLGNDSPSVARSARRGERTARHRTPRKVRLASLGGSFMPKPSTGPSLSGGSVRWVASSGCLNSGLRAIVASVASSFGPVTVNSTCRGRRHNARVGGARHSHHLTGNAADFRVRGNWRGVMAFLRSSGAGGIKHYGGGLFHIDTGPRRTW